MCLEEFCRAPRILVSGESVESSPTTLLANIITLWPLLAKASTTTFPSFSMYMGTVTLNTS
jgi:hypothetical protein